MIGRFFEIIELPISIEQFHKLPYNAAYKYEYFGKRGVLTPRPKFSHVILQLRDRLVAPDEIDAQATVRVRPLRDGDWDMLAGPFSHAFFRVFPFSALDDDQRRDAGSQCLRHTRDSGDGPVIAPACFAATDDEQPVGAILVTLWPDRDPSDWHAGDWPEPPPPDCVQKRLGIPHLTWIFVDPIVPPWWRSPFGRGVTGSLGSSWQCIPSWTGWPSPPGRFNCRSILWKSASRYWR